MNAMTSFKDATATSGVQGWSSQAAFDTYVIFCVGNDKYREAAFKAWALSNAIGFKELVGCYKGVTEAAFIVNQKQAELISPWIRDEESVLVLGPQYRAGKMYGNREAHLYRDGLPPEHIGLFGHEPRDFALKQDSWTFDPSDGTYWVAKL